MRKKALSALLAFGMIVSLLPGQAFAEAAPQAEEALFEETQTEEALSEEAQDGAALFATGEPVSLRVEAPDGMTVEDGTALDITGLKVYAVYADGEEEVTDYAVNLPEPAQGESRLGVRNAVVRYGELTETFPVTVTEEDYVAGIAVIVKPKKEYTQGEPLDLTGMQVLVAHHFRENNEILRGEQCSQCSITGYNPNQLGVQTLTVSYGVPSNSSADSSSSGVKSAEILVRVSPGAGQSAPDNLPSLMAPRMKIESVAGGKNISFTRDGNDDSSFYSSKHRGEPYPMEGTKIYYTLDGSAPAPGEAGTYEYDGRAFLTEETLTIKAMAVLGEEKSAVSSGRVTVSQVAQPKPANEHHRNNQGPNGGMTELEPGTLVSFLCDTAGASIYYYFEGSTVDERNARYGSSVYVDGTYANDEGVVTLKAYARKDGCKNSGKMTLKYRVPKEEPPPAELVYISAGTVRSRAGEALSASLSITTEETSGVTSFTITVRYDRRSFQFESVSPAETGGANSRPVIPAGELFAAPDPAQGLVRVMYNGEAVSGGEMCALNFRAMDSAEDKPYPLEVDADSARVSTNSGRPVEQEKEDGEIILEGSHNSQLAVLFSGEDDNAATNVEQLSDSSNVNASFSIDRETAQEYVNSLPSDDAGNPPTMVTANAFVAFYGYDGNMLSLETWEIDLSDYARLLFERWMAMPEEAAEIKAMVLSETLTPIIAPGEL